MKLLLERFVYRDWLGRKVYRLTVGAEVHAVERQVIDANHLLDDEIWCSSTYLGFEGEAESAFNSASQLEGWFLSRDQVWRRINMTRDGLRSLRDGFAEARVTVSDLLHSISFEGRDVGQLLSIEGGVRNGVDALQQRLEMLARYEAGGGMIVEPEQQSPRASPVAWVKMR